MTESDGFHGTSMYFWMVILGGFVAFAMAWGIGANDVANAFATSVGSRAVTLKQAVMIAAVFEFAGAFFLGSQVTDTVRKKITDYSYFEDRPDILMLGFFCSLVSAAIVLILVTRFSIPVSTTQTIVGAIIGFVLVAEGSKAVEWDMVVNIVIFWILSPFFSALVCMSLFFPIRQFWLRGPNALQKVMRSWGFFIFLVAFVMSLFMIMKGLKRVELADELGFDKAAWIAVLVGIGLSGLGWLALFKPLSAYVEKKAEETPPVAEEGKQEQNIEVVTLNGADFASEDAPLRGGASESSVAPSPHGDATFGPVGGDDADKEKADLSESRSTGATSKMSLLKRKALKGVSADVHDDLEELELRMMDNAEKFDPKVERAFHWLQVCTAALGIFAHGSNDVANAVAPLAAMVALYRDPDVESKVGVPLWVLTLGALGMVVGLGTYGYRVIKTIGVRLVNMSSSRGYCIELSSALVVIIASHLGYPTSTTHAQVGSTVGVGALEVTRRNSGVKWSEVVNWKLLAQVLLSWVLAFAIAGLLSAFIFTLFAYTPSIRQGS